MLEGGPPTPRRKIGVREQKRIATQTPSREWRYSNAGIWTALLTTALQCFMETSQAGADRAVKQRTPWRLGNARCCCLATKKRARGDEQGKRATVAEPAKVHQTMIFTTGDGRGKEQWRQDKAEQARKPAMQRTRREQGRPRKFGASAEHRPTKGGILHENKDRLCRRSRAWKGRSTRDKIQTSAAAGRS
jgi:hypothetical protein